MKIGNYVRYYYFLSQSFLFEMAEWGKGDPRWIVEERPDGKKNNDILFF